MSRHTGEALAALAEKECKSAIRALSRAQDQHRAIHEARKAIRRLRGVLALGRRPFAERWEPIDKALRQLALSLSALRDTHVVITTAATLAERSHANTWKSIASGLKQERDRMLADALLKDPKFSKRCARLRFLGELIEQLPWRRVNSAEVKHALKQAERRVTKSTARFAEKPTAENLHRWRRRVRRRRLQLEAFRKISRAAGAHVRSDSAHTTKAIRVLNRLSDKLGEQQDLRVLSRKLKLVVAPQTLTRLRADIRRELGQSVSAMTLSKR